MHTAEEVRALVNVNHPAQKFRMKQALLAHSDLLEAMNELSSKPYEHASTNHGVFAAALALTAEKQKARKG